MSRSQTDTIIKINSLGVIEIETLFDDGSRQNKNISFDDLCDAIRSSVEPTQEIEVTTSPVLPNNDTFGVKTVAYRSYSDGREQYVLFKKAHRCDVTYHTQKFEQCGIPNLLFIVTLKDNHVRAAYVVAVLDDVIKDTTPIYHYPFSNASSGNGSICFGGNKIFDYQYEKPHNLFGLPSMFLEMPNNDHMYGQNNAKMPYRKLLEELTGNDFNNDFLKPMECTFDIWFNKKVLGGGY